MIHHIIDLLEPPKAGSRIDFADFLKTGFALYGVAIHSIVAVVTPIGVYVVTRLTGITASVTTVWLQPLINVHGLHFISFLGGLSMGFSVYPALKKGKAKPISLIINRWLRNAPGMLCLLSLEFLWPLAGSGPLYTFVGQDILDNCHANWYRNVLFFTNYNPVMENCMNHTFWSSIDFQLFILGVVIMMVLARNRTLGITLIVLAGLGDFLVSGIIAHVYQTTHAMAAHPITVEKVIQYIDYIHNQTTNYMFTFIFGMSIGIYVVTGRNNTWSVGYPGVVIGLILLQLSSYSTVVYNNFGDLVDKAYIPIYLAGVKLFLSTGIALWILFFTYTPSKDTQETKETKKDTKKTDQVKAPPTAEPTNYFTISETDWGYRLFFAVSRLSTSLYLVNYWFIRWDFFTVRVPFETSIISFFKRFGYSVCFSEILAFLFYTILLAPIDSYRKMLFSPKEKLE